jgi:hypothetical protein
MVKQSGGDGVNRGPAPEPDRDRLGEAAVNVREMGQDSSPDDPHRAETPDSDGGAARDRAS